jgi:ATP-dependent Lon protease
MPPRGRRTFKCLSRASRAIGILVTDPRSTEIETLPILPLRNSVVFPASVVPINVGRSRSVRLVEDLLGQERAVVGIISQKDAEVDEPGFQDLYEVGTVARVVKVIRLGPSNYSVVLHGLARLRMQAPVSLEPYMRGRVKRIAEDLERDAELDALGASLRQGMREVLNLMPNLPRETAGILDNVRESGALADLIASNLTPEQATVQDKQKILETLDAKARVRQVLGIVNRQLELLRVKKEISTMVADEGKNQREQILRQQMRSIREELGEAGDEDEIEELRERIRAAQLSEEASKVAKKQLGRLAGMQPQSAEYNVTRTYLEWLADMPWSKSTTDKIDVEATRRCLDEDHFGLEKIKKRIIEYMAVRKLRGDKKGPILCFIGPPGVGKTSLGRSIARSMGRRYHRIALGGVRDEAEIRGHRRTYVGALPGRIIQGLKKVGVKNPVFVLDEVDKMGVDLLGDPAAALLEVLDPEQNSTFADHYLDVPFDLSQVTFLATANNPDTIPGPLYDRMEVIEVPGYTRAEKKSIAKEFLCPKQLSAHGLTDERLEFVEEGVEKIIDSYTREAGVRGLEREIGAVCRHVAMRLAEGETTVFLKADAEAVEKILGPARYLPDLAERTSSPGVATGLAWTPTGGDILFIEATMMPGKGDVMVTGNLKSVMTESAHTAMSFVRSKAQILGLDPEFLKTKDMHLHVPKGGTPKDGPSAGITMFTAVASLLLNAPVKRHVAMTGEITLRGAILPVGGIKEKLLAAHRAGIQEVLVPSRNERDVEEVPKDVREQLKVHLVKRIDEVLPLVLEPPAASGETPSMPPPAPPPEGGDGVRV